MGEWCPRNTKYHRKDQGKNSNPEVLWPTFCRVFKDQDRLCSLRSLSWAHSSMSCKAPHLTLPGKLSLEWNQWNTARYDIPWLGWECMEKWQGNSEQLLHSKLKETPNTKKCKVSIQLCFDGRLQIFHIHGPWWTQPTRPILACSHLGRVSTVCKWQRAGCCNFVRMKKKACFLHMAFMEAA